MLRSSRSKDKYTSFSASIISSGWPQPCATRASEFVCGKPGHRSDAKEGIDVKTLAFIELIYRSDLVDVGLRKLQLDHHLGHVAHRIQPFQYLSKFPNFIFSNPQAHDVGELGI